MCGIVGYVGQNVCAAGERIALDGLRRLEYRGYDSAGLAVAGPHGVSVRKRAGKLAALRTLLQERPLPPGYAAIGHTRWATHGRPSDANAHPHTGGGGRVALVHNGIIENAAQLRAELGEPASAYASDTDSEVIAHLLAAQLAAPECPRTLPGLPADTDPAAARLLAALHAVTARLEGTFTILALDARAPRFVAAARRSSPLVIGLGGPGRGNALASDALAFAPFTTDCLEIGQDQVALVGAASVVVCDAAGRRVEPKRFVFAEGAAEVGKDGWSTYMEKEIHEQPRAVADTLADRLDAAGRLTLDELRIPLAVLRRADKVVIIACGTSFYAGQVARYAIEHWCRIPCEVELASEFRYRDPVVDERTLVVAISQSGETMDTIMAVRHAREQGASVLAIVNTASSTICRESDAVLLTHAGREIAVASTKAFTAQLAACYLLGLYLAQVRGNKYGDEIADYMDKLGRIPALMRRALGGAERVRQTARRLAEGASSVLFLGRHVGYPVALEGALKLKEIAYLHAEGCAAGELKHGPIALVEDGVPVVVIVPTPRRPQLHAKVLANIKEVQARGAYTIVVAEEGDEDAAAHADVVLAVPAAPTLYLPLLTVIPLQLLACQVAQRLGYDVDQPRNLAKSVTVE